MSFFGRYALRHGFIGIVPEMMVQKRVPILPRRDSIAGGKRPQAQLPFPGTRLELAQFSVARAQVLAVSPGVAVADHRGPHFFLTNEDDRGAAIPVVNMERLQIDILVQYHLLQSCGGLLAPRLAVFGRIDATQVHRDALIAKLYLDGVTIDDPGDRAAEPLMFRGRRLRSE